MYLTVSKYSTTCTAMLTLEMSMYTLSGVKLCDCSMIHWGSFCVNRLWAITWVYIVNTGQEVAAGRGNGHEWNRKQERVIISKWLNCFGLILFQWSNSLPSMWSSANCYFTQSSRCAIPLCEQLWIRIYCLYNIWHIFKQICPSIFLQEYILPIRCQLSSEHWFLTPSQTQLLYQHSPVSIVWKTLGYSNTHKHVHTHMHTHTQIRNRCLVEFKAEGRFEYSNLNIIVM